MSGHASPESEAIADWRLGIAEWYCRSQIGDLLMIANPQ
jgi:hypothetical protein